MATDISATLLPMNKVPFDFQTPVKRLAFDISPVTLGVAAVTTHTLQNIAAKYALVGGEIIFITSLDSAGDDATLAFTFNGVAFTGTITQAGSAAGCVYKIVPNIASATAGVDVWGNDAVSPIVMTVGTGAVTAGRFILILDLIDVTAFTGNG